MDKRRSIQEMKGEVDRLKAYVLFLGIQQEIKGTKTKLRTTGSSSCYATAKKRYKLTGNRITVLIKLHRLIASIEKGLKNDNRNPQKR